MRRNLPALVALACLAAGGCVATRSDLSAPSRWQPLEDEPVTVAADGSVLPIYTDDRPEHRWAARFLADTIEETCGLRPALTVGLPAVETNGLFVGSRTESAAADDLGPEGFRVIAGNGRVQFLGRADYAVFDWCERELALRYYGKGGKCVEPRQTIVAQAVDYADRPVFEHRMISSGLGEDWVRVAKAGSAHRGGVAVHAPHNWFRDEKLKAEHPGIFETGETPMLCYGNPETLAYYQRRIDRHIAGLEDSGGIVDTKRKVVTVCQWDAPIRCNCPHCRDLYAPGEKPDAPSASPIIWGRFAAKLAVWLKDAHPDYMISFLPYLNSCAVATGTDGGDLGLGNAEAEVCTMTGLALLKNPARREREETLLADWQRVTRRKVLNWDYECWPKDWTSAPYVFGRTIQTHYAALRDTLCGVYVCGGASDPRTELSVYIWMKSLWNPDFDVERVYDEYARRMFGPAAPPMRALIAIQEAGWNRPWPDDACSYHNVFELSYPPAVVARIEDLMVAADEIATQAGEPFAGRVQRYLSGLETFVAEAEANAARVGRLEIRPNAVSTMVQARDVWTTNVWAQTEVVTRTEGGELLIRARCLEPAAARLDFAHDVDDYVWGNDAVTFVLEDDGAVRKVERRLRDAVCRDAESWTVEARFALSERARREGRVLGNVCRWRVGDRRRPKAEQVAGSRYEHTRLDTRFTSPDDDPAAFVVFRWGPSPGR